jgi:hypothetical protein
MYGRRVWFREEIENVVLGPEAKKRQHQRADLGVNINFQVEAP